MKANEILKIEVEAAVEDMSIMLMNPDRPKEKPWRMVPADELVERILPLCEFVRGCEACESKLFAQQAHEALEYFLFDPVYEEREDE